MTTQRLSFVAVSLLLVGCASARPWTETLSTEQPPVIDSPSRTIYATPTDVITICEGRTGGAASFGLEGCHDPYDNVKVVPFPGTEVGGLYGHTADEIWKHEDCHALGWPPDHSGPRPAGCR